MTTITGRKAFLAWLERESAQARAEGRFNYKATSPDALVEINYDGCSMKLQSYANTLDRVRRRMHQGAVQRGLRPARLKDVTP